MEKDRIELLNPEIIIEKNEIPVVFIDTFMWNKLLIENAEERRLLEKCCSDKKIVIAFTNFLKGELISRNIFDMVRQICNESYIIIPVGNISANQAIQSMVCYYENIKKVKLSWDLAISEVPVLYPPETGLKYLTRNLQKEINKAKLKTNKNKELFISIFAQIERDFWKEYLEVYWKSMIDNDSKINNKNGKSKIKYENFFYTDYFSNLPFLVLKSYLLGYILNERDMKTQD